LPGTISGSCWALVEPGPSAAIHRTIKSANAPTLWGRGLLADPISGHAVLEYGATEILPPVGAILKHPARLCRPGRQATPHSRAESRGSRHSKAARGERQTLRWREMDSNFRFPDAPSGVRPRRGVFQ